MGIGVHVGSEEKLGLGPSIETATKAAALCLGFLYVCGFLVVTVYLGQYGILSPGLLQVQYVGAGVLLIAPLFLTYNLVALVSFNLQRATSFSVANPSSPRVESSLRRTLKVLWFLFCAFIVGLKMIEASLPLFTVNWWSTVTHWSTLWPYLNLMLMAIVLAYLVYYSWWALRFVLATGSIIQRNVKTLSFPFIVCAVSIVYFVFYVSYFSSKIYPQIPHELGGGRPISVVFLLKSSEGQSLQPLTPDASGRRSIPYKLLIESDNAYIVLSPDAKEFVLRINKDAVNGLTILREP